jgi:hypothetical protein
VSIAEAPEAPAAHACVEEDGLALTADDEGKDAGLSDLLRVINVGLELIARDGVVLPVA